MKLKPKTNRGKIGEVPGSIVVDAAASPTSIHSFSYNSDTLTEHDGLPPADADGVIWIDAVGLGDVDALNEIQERFSIHPLAMEDVVNVTQRSRSEWYESGVYAVLRRYEREDALASEQLSFYLVGDVVVSFQERTGDCFEPVRDRLRGSKGRIRHFGADYLLFALIDSVVDSYFPLLEQYDDRFNEIEAALLVDERDIPRGSLYALRTEIRELRRGIWPTREMILQLTRIDGIITPKAAPFFRDALEHSTSTVYELDNLNDGLSALIDFQNTQVGNRMNEIMKVLTIVSSVFIPLGFLAGLYGMNFNTEHPANLPELGFAYGYPTLLFVMISIVIGMLFFFRRKHWI